MNYQVSKVCQTASGGSFVAKYNAYLELRADDPRIEVEVVSTYPASADQELVKIATESIRSGAEEILAPRGYGASLRINRLVIHDVDFKPWAFRRFTAEAIAKLLNVPWSDSPLRY